MRELTRDELRQVNGGVYAAPSGYEGLASAMVCALVIYLAFKNWLSS